jgi:hypothetical protein
MSRGSYLNDVSIAVEGDETEIQLVLIVPIGIASQIEALGSTAKSIWIF